MINTFKKLKKALLTFDSEIAVLWYESRITQTDHFTLKSFLTLYESKNHVRVFHFSMVLSGGIVSTELELELHDIKSILLFCSSSFIFYSLRLIFSRISLSMVAKEDRLHVSSITGVSSREEGTS